ncbi:TylF/MycF/NovP-related O-methyltransferase [Puia sp.]|uniref:TylF/MycF/NovP-related O-methyltransferase n=1 Tax=Puia sp. TaxID=2045100 RepID=UPI002F3FBE85
MSIFSKLKEISTPGSFVLNRQLHNDLLSARGNLSEDLPADFSPVEREDIRAVRPFTMTSPERLVSLSRGVDHLVQQRIGGDIVECGVWKGGSMLMVARKLARAGDTARGLFLFDTYEGMSEPTKEDVSAVDQTKAGDLLDAAERTDGDNVWCYSPIDEVKANLNSSGYPPEKMHFIKGKVEDTLPEPSIGPIALLRLDTDWYESTKHELETLYDKLVPGGILIIDDYGHWSGSQKAVDEFIAARSLSIFLHRIDYTGRMAIKS